MVKMFFHWFLKHSKRLYESLQDYPSAEKHFKMALQENRFSVFAHTAYAGFLYRVKLDFESAEKHYAQAVVVDPFSAIAHHKYAVFLKNTRRSHTSLCESHVRSAVRLDPSRKKFWNDFLQKRDDIKGAIDDPFRC